TQLAAAVDASSCPSRLKQVLRILVDEAEHASVAGQTLRLQGVLDMQKLDTFFNQVQTNIEIWFNNSMERVSGLFKRKVQAVTLAVAVVFAVGLNLDTVLIARHLARDSAFRSAIVAEAETIATQPLSTGEGATKTQLVQDRIQELKAVGIPFGWPDPDGSFLSAQWLLRKVLGLLLTACAPSLGPPFCSSFLTP